MARYYRPRPPSYLAVDGLFGLVKFLVNFSFIWPMRILYHTVKWGFIATAGMVAALMWQVRVYFQTKNQPAPEPVHEDWQEPDRQTQEWTAAEFQSQPYISVLDRHNAEIERLAAQHYEAMRERATKRLL